MKFLYLSGTSLCISDRSLQKRFERVEKKYKILVKRKTERTRRKRSRTYTKNEKKKKLFGVYHDYVDLTDFG